MEYFRELKLSSMIQWNATKKYKKKHTSLLKTYYIITIIYIL